MEASTKIELDEKKNIVKNLIPKMDLLRRSL